MSADIELRGSTKLSDPPATYPRPKEELPLVNEKFRMLNFPLGKIMAKRQPFPKWAGVPV